MSLMDLDDVVANVSRETRDRLYAYAALIKKWNPKINLVSKNSLDDFWHRHIVDSAQIYPLLLDDTDLWVDLGSGGGLPAVVLAILALGDSRNTRFVLVESDHRKSAFLRTASRELGLAFEVTTKRSEEIAPLAAKTLSARAFAPLESLLEHAQRHLRPDGRAIFPKGRTALQEIEAARAHWRFDLDLVPSKTDPDAQILIVSGIARA